MDIDVEVIVACEDAVAAKLVQRVPSQFAAAHQKGRLIVRCEVENIQGSADKVVQEFLASLGGLQKLLPPGNHQLRIGLFFSPSESVVLSLQLAPATVKAIAEFGTSLEVTGYPCGDE